MNRNSNTRMRSLHRITIGATRSTYEGDFRNVYRENEQSQCNNCGAKNKRPETCCSSFSSSAFAVFPELRNTAFQRLFKRVSQDKSSKHTGFPRDARSPLPSKRMYRLLCPYSKQKNQLANVADISPKCTKDSNQNLTTPARTLFNINISK